MFAFARVKLRSNAIETFLMTFFFFACTIPLLNANFLVNVSQCVGEQQAEQHGQQELGHLLVAHIDSNPFHRYDAL